jgi:AcrR family transcriptional regulator
MPSVTRRTQSSRAQRRDEIRLRLLAAIKRLLEEDTTFTELSVEQLVREAEISRSTFYLYFEDKGALLRALTVDVIDGILAAAAFWGSLPADATREDLREAMGRIFDAYRPHRMLMAAVIETAPHDAAARDQYASLMEGTIAAVAGHVRDGQRQGFVDPSLDPQRTAAWLTWMTERGLYQFAGAASGGDVERQLTALTDIVWSGLYAGTR